MTDIDAIMELAVALEPGQTTRPEFRLWNDAEGKWHARVSMSRYYVLTENHGSPDAALKKLREELLGLNRTFLARLTATIQRWDITQTVLRLVKGDPTDKGA